jgi:hypothetical protein
MIVRCCPPSVPTALVYSYSVLTMLVKYLAMILLLLSVDLDSGLDSYRLISK